MSDDLKHKFINNICPFELPKVTLIKERTHIYDSNTICKNAHATNSIYNRK